MKEMGVGDDSSQNGPYFSETYQNSDNPYEIIAESPTKYFRTTQILPDSPGQNTSLNGKGRVSPTYILCSPGRWGQDKIYPWQGRGQTDPSATMQSIGMGQDRAWGWRQRTGRSDTAHSMGGGGGGMSRRSRVTYISTPLSIARVF